MAESVNDTATTRIIDHRADAQTPRSMCAPPTLSFPATCSNSRHAIDHLCSTPARAPDVAAAREPPPIGTDFRLGIGAPPAYRAFHDWDLVQAEQKVREPAER